MTDLSQSILSCRSCYLCKKSQPLPGSQYNKGTRLMFVGVAPSKEEDIARHWNEGVRGLYLAKVMHEAGVSDNDIVITGLTKCSTTYDSEPKEDAIFSCIHWLIKEVDTVSPKYIFSAGKTVTKILLNIKKKTFKLADYVGNEYPFGNNFSMVVPVYGLQTCVRRGYPTYAKMVEILKTYKEKV